MLYNQDWDKPKVKADPFSLESLIAWLEKMPADEVYCFSNWGGCLLAKWAQSVDPSAYTGRQGRKSDFPNGFHYAVNGRVVDLGGFKGIASGIYHSREWTFGAALTRAREALASRA